MPDLYGRKAWLVIGLAAAGWALAVIFMLAYVGMYYTAYHYYLATYQLASLYQSLYRNYTVLAYNALMLTNYTIAVLNYTTSVLNYTDYVLTINTNELAGYNATTIQYARLLNETVSTLRVTDKLLNATVSALNTYNQVMGRLVNATGG
ncbi:MAG: hypothetical protein AT718_11370 [Vulcanisaeta sp. JCHS_4]|jgi:hypothetical protein|nr:MAG: hypothetical protein AT718_11370 [Vulcanisaeta sp. JCHS_4]